MKNIILFSLVFLFISCGGGDSEEVDSNNSTGDFPNYVDSNNLRIFARKGVSTTFLNNVGLAYKLGLDGAYIPSFNNCMKHNQYNKRQKFTVIGSAHNVKEIIIKH